jgi:hypothetical protein
MSASRKSGYYWVKYVNQNHWSIEYWNGGMWFTRNSHLVEDSMFSTIDETPIVREQKQTEQQINCNLPHVVGRSEQVPCEHEEKTMQGNGFTYVICSRCGADL